MFCGLHFSSASSLELCGYSHVNWNEDAIDRRSTMGDCFFLGSSLVFRHNNQYLTDCSSTELEYRVIVDTTQELVWLRLAWVSLNHPIQFFGATTTMSFEYLIMIFFTNVSNKYTLIFILFTNMFFMILFAFYQSLPLIKHISSPKLSCMVTILQSQIGLSSSTPSLKEGGGWKGC